MINIGRNEIYGRAIFIEYVSEKYNFLFVERFSDNFKPIQKNRKQFIINSDGVEIVSMPLKIL